MSDEEWRPVLGYEGGYEVSSLGRVRSLDRTVTRRDCSRHTYRGRVLKQKFQHYYFRIGLTKRGVTTSFCVHRLVCEAFHGPRPTSTSVVRHLNGEHTDNRPENLTWGTCAENTADMVRHGRAYWANQTHCIHGHKFTSENTRVVITRTGRQRNCRECERVRAVVKNQKRDAKRREQRPYHTCHMCGSAFQTAYRQAKFCSKECKKVSRRVGFTPKEVAA